MTDKTAADLYDVHEVVSLRIDRAKVTSINGDTMTLGTDLAEEIVLDVADEQVTVIRVTPADGEPRAGELWRDSIDSLWFAVRDGKQIWLVGADADVQHTSRSRVSWLDVHRGITGPIRRVWWGEAGQVVDAPTEAG